MKKLVIALMLAMSATTATASAQYVTAFQEKWTVDTTSIYRASNYDLSVIVYKQINNNKPKAYNVQFNCTDGVWYTKEGSEWKKVEYNSIAGYILDTCNGDS